MDPNTKTKSRSKSPKKTKGKCVEHKKAKSHKKSPVKQETFRGKLKRKFDLSQTKGKDKTPPSDKDKQKKKGSPVQLTSPVTSSSGSKQSKASSQAKVKENKSVGTKLPPQAEKRIATPPKERVTGREKSRAVEVQKKVEVPPKSRKSDSLNSLGLGDSSSDTSSDSSSDSDKSTEGSTTSIVGSVESSGPMSRAKTKTDKVKPRSLMDANEGISSKGSEIASKMPKKEEQFKLKVSSNLGESVISSPSVWMEVRGQKEPGTGGVSEPSSHSIRLPDNID